jgi:hypothetical protein
MARASFAIAPQFKQTAALFPHIFSVIAAIVEDGGHLSTELYGLNPVRSFSGHSLLFLSKFKRGLSSWGVLSLLSPA